MQLDYEDIQGSTTTPRTFTDSGSYEVSGSDLRLKGNFQYTFAVNGDDRTATIFDNVYVFRR